MSSIAMLFAACAVAQPVDTSLRKILTRPADFNGKLVRVRGVVRTGFEASLLAGDDGSTVWLAWAEPREPKDAETAEIDSFADLKTPEKLRWEPATPKTPVTLVEDANLKRLNRLLRKQYKIKGGLCIDCPQYEVTATITGRFDWAVHKMRAYRTKNPPKMRVTSGGFGHLRAEPGRIVLQRVEEIDARKLPPPSTSSKPPVADRKP